MALLAQRGRGTSKGHTATPAVHVSPSTSLKPRGHSLWFDLAEVTYGKARSRLRDEGPMTLATGANTGVPISSRSLQDISKRLSLPMDIRLPQEFLQKLQLESPDLPKPLSRMSRRASLVSP